jgi:DNA-binding NarL/FixJ family response regulator
MINTVLVEDDLYMQKHLADALAAQGDFHIVAAVRDAFEAEKLCSPSVDLVLMDVMTLHKHSGLAAGRRIKQAHPRIKVVIVTSLVDPDVLLQAKRGCADSLWYKDCGTEQLTEVLRRTLAGEHIFPDFSPSVEMKMTFSENFTPAQIEILRAFIRGDTYKEIADKFNLSVSGVRWNMAEMIRLGQFKNKEELINTAIENKLVVATLTDGEKEDI